MFIIICLFDKTLYLQITTTFHIANIKIPSLHSVSTNYRTDFAMQGFYSSV
jgi:hypothetical protein